MNTNLIFPEIKSIFIAIGFLLTLILLIITLALTVWFFKFSSSLYAIEILLLVLNVLSINSSIILRIWRSNGSVLHENFSASNAVANFNLVFIIMNFLLSIVEEVLFSLTLAFMTIYYFLLNSLNNLNDDDDEDYGWNWTPNNVNKKIIKNFYRIMDKLNWGKKKFDFDDDNFEEIVKKLNILQILPWITFNFNILIQFIMFIFILILIGRIKRKSDFGFPRNDTKLTSHNRKLGKRKSKNIQY